MSKITTDIMKLANQLSKATADPSIKATTEFEVILQSRWIGELTPYCGHSLAKTNDVFRAQATVDEAWDMWVASNQKSDRILFRAREIRNRAKKHSHPNWPCGLDEKKKGYWSCGAKVESSQAPVLAT